MQCNYMHAICAVTVCNQVTRIYIYYTLYRCMPLWACMIVCIMCHQQHGLIIRARCMKSHSHGRSITTCLRELIQARNCMRWLYKLMYTWQENVYIIYIYLYLIDKAPISHMVVLYISSVPCCTSWPIIATPANSTVMHTFGTNGFK